jgi:FkbM family methyltransferase
MVALKKMILGTPLERLARRLYIRLDPSPSSKYDRLTLAIMRRCLRVDSNGVDIGAHRGTILAEMLQLAPAGHHYAFEPVPQHSQYLAKAFPMVRVHTLALSNVRHETSFLHDRRYPTRSSFRRREGVLGEQEVITVQTDLLDNIIPETERIAFIKVDVEGAELEVMQGGVKTLQTQRPVVVFEHTQMAQECFGVAPEEIYNFLTLECGLQISLMQSWLMRTASLSSSAFRKEVTEGRSLYFVAHP